jgi:hypothetical protein
MEGTCGVWRSNEFPSWGKWQHMVFLVLPPSPATTPQWAPHLPNSRADYFPGLRKLSVLTNFPFKRMGLWSCQDLQADQLSAAWQPMGRRTSATSAFRKTSFFASTIGHAPLLSNFLHLSAMQRSINYVKGLSTPPVPSHVDSLKELRSRHSSIETVCSIQRQSSGWFVRAPDPLLGLKTLLSALLRGSRLTCNVW